MKEYARERLERAKAALDGARRDLTAGAADLAADRSYYAMFYVAEALLSERGLHFSRHGTLHGAFGQEFAKERVLDPKYHRWLLDAFKARQEATYGTPPAVTADQARELIAQAEEFILVAREYMKNEE